VTVYFQVEFYSDGVKRWVPLFAKFPSAEDALEQAKGVPPPRRVTKVTQTVEVVAEGNRLNENY
jgi:hypothetical protein